MPTDIYIQYHYTYLITNTTNQMKYIGVRSCSCLPENDDGYMGSSKILNEAMGIEPEDFVKTIIDTFPTRKNANSNEQWLHEYYDVARNPEFYNRCIAPMGFCASGKHVSDSTKKKMSEAKSGEKHPSYGIPRSDETRKKISNSTRGGKNHRYGKSVSAETLSKMREGKRGEKCYMYGKHHSAETRAKMSEAKMGKIQPKTTCPHCLQIGGESNMKRSHFDNCKEISTKS